MKELKSKEKKKNLNDPSTLSSAIEVDDHTRTNARTNEGKERNKSKSEK